MPREVAELLSELRPDSWRRDTGFSHDLDTTNQELFANAASADDASKTLGAWLRTYQSCLFGRIAATFERITYCILSPADLSSSDEHIHSRIQTCRREWTKQAFEGEKSAFIILAVSPELASATPDSPLLALAARLCSLYLEEEEVQPDEIYLDTIYLESTDQTKSTWVWDAGVNYFAANADGRWWNDHRIPGGIGFSVNSVGHMVKAGFLAEASELKVASQSARGKKKASRPSSLGQALELAMRTIGMASNTISGRATSLVDATEGEAPCPIELSSPLAGKNCHLYRGYYHTDFTLPSEYFRSDVERPPDLPVRDLDFTYLFRKELANPAHRRMGEGRQIRATLSQGSYLDRALKTIARLERIKDHARLVEALSHY